MTSSPHGPYGLGYTRATMVKTMGRYFAKRCQSQKLGLSSDGWLHLKGIDGGPHKRWSMWFNSTQREEPYQPLTWPVAATGDGAFSSAGQITGAAWLSSARVVRCSVKSGNERNPRL